jgi:hypothetical protein
MKELLFSITKKDLNIDYFSGTGAGGQYRNKHQNCVRLKHIESGAFATGQSNRDRKSNIKEAMDGLAASPKFKLWIARKILEIESGKTIEAKVEEMMTPENLKIEFKNENKWIEENYEKI